jgi:hypothetical protein
MNADVNNQQECQCELCRPNWHLGQDDNFFERQPAEQPARQVTLEENHLRKVAKKAFEFAEATG